MEKSKPKPKPRVRLAIPAYAERALKPSFQDSLLAFTYRILRRPAKWMAGVLPEYGQGLQKAGIAISAEAYLSLVIFVTILAAPVTALGVYWALASRQLLVLPLAAAVPIAFMLGLNYPKAAAGSRSSAVDHELALVIGYITVLAGGGILPTVTLRRLSEIELYPAIAKEAKRIVMDIEIFGMDPITALDKAARTNPNRAFAEFLGGYTSILKTGGDVLSFMEVKLRDIFAYRTIKLKAASEFIGTLTEAYISVTVILGISLFTLFAIQAVLPGSGGASALNSIVLFSAVFTPLVSVMFIYLVHSIQHREPFTYYRPYMLFAGLMAMVPIMVYLPVQLPLFTRLAVGLAVPSFVGAAIYMKYARFRHRLEGSLPDFIRDIAEVRKTGLAPERCIEQLANRQYGVLTKYVAEMSAQLSWGVPLRKVMTSFSAKVKSWLARAVAFLLLEVVDVGGGTVKMFANLADFTQRMGEIEKEKRAALRAFIFIPYIGAVLIVVTVLMMLYFLTAPLGNQQVALMAGVNTGQVTSILLTSSVFQSWIMGLVAGKLGEESVAAGFKHAGLLAAISLITIYASASFIPIPLT